MTLSENSSQYKIGFIYSGNQDGINRVGYFDCDILNVIQLSWLPEQMYAVVKSPYLDGDKYIDLNKALENTKAIKAGIYDSLFNSFFVADNDFSEDCINNALRLKCVRRGDVVWLMTK